MSPKRASQREQRRRQILLARIARVRRRIDRRVGRIADRSLLSGSWRVNVRNRPGRSLLAATAAGFALAVLLGRARPGRRAGSIDRSAAHTLWEQIGAGLLALVASRGRSGKRHAEPERTDE